MLNILELKKNAKLILSGAPTIKMALLGDTATQLLATAIRGMGVDRGYNIDLFEAEYNQVEHQTLDPTSDLYKFDAEFIVIFQSTHKLVDFHAKLSAEQQTSLADIRLNFLSTVCSNSIIKTKKIIYFNYPEIGDTIFGNYSNKVSSSLTYQVRKLNYELMNLSQQFPNLYICDLAELQNKIGRDVMFAPNIYTTTELVISNNALPFAASRLMDIVCAIKGQIKKCLILDLDNTLWGGVIGDDGIEGVKLGHDLGIGRAFTEFQTWVKKLKQRGIIICIASKNDEKIAKDVFNKHPDMVLKLEDIAVFQANWDTKVDNIRTIQSILNIGFDSMVFLDDNPFERAMVRENIQGITVPELPEDPAEYLEYLYSLNLFETASFSTLDNDRTKQYQVEAQRVSLSKTFTNEADFLRSLNMVSSVSGFSKFNIPRIAQLSQRSNQFNLRTVRYTESDIENLAEDNNVVGLCFTLEDKFGDNGLVSVIIMKKLDNETLFVDTWIMSCRVLKRGMEYFVLNMMVEYAKAGGFKKIIGEYLPTHKNQIVADHYLRIGFNKVKGCINKFELNIENYIPKESMIQVRSNDTF